MKITDFNVLVPSDLTSEQAKEVCDAVDVLVKYNYISHLAVVITLFLDNLSKELGEESWWKQWLVKHE